MRLTAEFFPKPAGLVTPDLCTQRISHTHLVSLTIPKDSSTDSLTAQRIRELLGDCRVDSAALEVFVVFRQCLLLKREKKKTKTHITFVLTELSLLIWSFGYCCFPTFKHSLPHLPMFGPLFTDCHLLHETLHMCSSPFDKRLARVSERDLLGLGFSHQGFDMGQDVHGNRLRKSSEFLELEEGQEMSGREK